MISTIRHTYKGVEITYSEKANVWCFNYDGADREEPSLAAAKKRIDKKPKFKRLKVWTNGRWNSEGEIRSGELTSLADQNRYGWVVFDGREREKVWLSRVWPKSESNDRTVAEILRRKSEIEQLEKEIETLEESLTAIEVPGAET